MSVLAPKIPEKQPEKYPVEHSTKKGKATAGQQQLPTAQLALTLGRSTTGKTVLKERYMRYPLSVSPVFRLDDRGDRRVMDEAGVTEIERVQRAYLYRMNTSPGLLAGDVLGMSLKLTAGCSLLLADQAATKVHTMLTNVPTGEPIERQSAAVNYHVEVGDRATLEFLPEPLILFTDSALTQTTDITLHASAGLTWGEIILPGRLARGERYEFRAYVSRTRLKSSDDAVWFIEAMQLLGKANPFAHSDLFASGAVLGNLILALPQEISTRENLSLLTQQIDQLNDTSGTLELASSVLPGDRGLFVRAIATTTRDLQAAFKAATNSVRKLRHHPPLPYSL